MPEYKKLYEDFKIQGRSAFAFASKGDGKGTLDTLKNFFTLIAGKTKLLLSSKLPISQNLYKMPTKILKILIGKKPFNTILSVTAKMKKSKKSLLKWE